MPRGPIGFLRRLAVMPRTARTTAGAGRRQRRLARAMKILEGALDGALGLGHLCSSEMVEESGRRRRESS
jgi:hypothetical protein